jgi:sulfonate transport system substrate-binding protein
LTSTTRARRLAKPLVALATMSAAIVVLAGCASTSSASTNDAAATGAAKSVSYPSVAQIQSYPEIAVGKQEGFLKSEFGSDPSSMTVSNVTTGADGVQAVATGHADIAIVGYDPASLVSTTNVKAIAVAEQSPATQAALVKPGSSIKKIADLKGKTIGSYTATPTAFISQILAKGGLTLSDVKYVQVENDGGAAALTSGAIDAWFTFDPFYAQAQLSNLATPLATGATVGYKNTVFIFANATYIKEHADSVTAFLKAFKKSTDWINANKSDAATIFSTSSGATLDVAKKSIARRHYQTSRVEGATVSWVKSFDALSVKVGVIQKEPDVAGFVNTSAYDKAFGK